MTKKRMSAGSAVWLSIALLFNSNINLLDPLPDCIAYLLLIYAIGGAANTVPYLSECKSALGKLALISAARIPAFFIMYNNLSTGRDIVPMFTLIFVAVESILLYSAIENGYKALSYIGERTDAAIAVRPFATDRRGGRMTPFSFKVLTMIFFLIKGILNLLPELMLLTPEETSLRRKLAEAYPAVLIICIFAALAVGAVWLSYAMKYLKALRASDEIEKAIAELSTKETPDEERKSKRLKAILNALTVLAVSSVFSLDLTFSDFGNINILPHFIYGIVLFYSVFSLTDNKKTRIALSVGTAAFTLSNIASHRFASRFFESYDYLHLLYFKSAKELYLPVKISAVIEAVFIVAVLVICGYIFADFVRENTGVSPTQDSYGPMAKKNHRSLIVRGSVLFSLAGIINVLKCVNVFLKGMVKLAFTEISDEAFTTGALPWMGTLIFALCVVFIIYSFYFIAEVKAEVKFKYSK